MNFSRAQALADAVLLEGYVLYPYRASSQKNRFRWTFGVLAPHAWSDAGGCEASWLEAQCLVEPFRAATLHGRLRFLQAQTRRVEQAEGDGFRPVDSLDVAGRLLLPWDEGNLCEVDFALPLQSAGEETVVPFSVQGHQEVEAIADGGGVVRARYVRERWPIEGRVRIVVEERMGEGGRPLLFIRARVENDTPFSRTDAPRDEALRASFIATHLLLGTRGAAFISLMDPPEWAKQAAAGCKNVRTYPVLAGEPGRTDLVLSAPIILYDHAQIAPESPGDLFDATEIDALLSLRASLLTDDEKREARATDERAAELLERVDHLSPEMKERLLGTFRELRSGEMIPRRIDERPRTTLCRGDRVRILPSKRRTDAQDVLFVGCVATVEAVLRDVDDREHVAVTLEDDPAAELNRWYGRFHYYALDEVEPLPRAEEKAG